MSSLDSGELLRATIAHTVRNPFLDSGALESYSDGALLIADGRIAAIGDYSQVRQSHPSVRVTDLRGGFLLPGFIDTHIHFPQVRIIGAFGYTLLDWLDRVTLPEESRLADLAYARSLASDFVNALIRNGTTTALVFGAHFPDATAALFEAASARGLRIISGLILSDRCLRPELEQSAEASYDQSTTLIRHYHGNGRLLYAVTPRFAISASESILDVCRALLLENPNVRFQTHLNENTAEIAEVKRLFPWSKDYLSVYDRFDLVGKSSIFAHSVHSTPAEIKRLASAGSAVAHCPSSNAALGSGLFPMRCHIESGVRCALGSDVGGGVGFSISREALQASLMQRIAPESMTLHAQHMLYLATLAGAEALGLETEIGNFEPGKAADMLYIRPPENSVLAATLQHADNIEQMLGAIFALSGPESIRQVRVGGTLL